MAKTLSLERIQKYIMYSIQSISKSSIWLKIGLVMLVVYVLLRLLSSDMRFQNNKIEGFTQTKKFVTKTGPLIYDNFYVDIYDDLVYDLVKNNFEIGEIERITKMTPQKSRILDIGSGTGHHVKMWTNRGFHAMGLDKSESMIAKAQEKYPDLNFTHGDALNGMLFPANDFTMIQCLYFTLYYMQDKYRFFENCFKWLKPGGYLVVHLVNRYMFDPIIGASDPLFIVSPQKYAKERITESVVKFNDLQYKAKFDLMKEQNKAVFSETFKDDKTGKIRVNDHVFYMPTQKEILGMAKAVGFNLLGKVDMITAQYEYQYLYILYKPN